MRLGVFSLMFLLAGGCVSPLDIGPVPYTARLVVNGLLTDVPGSQSITLSTSSPTHKSDSVGKVSGAAITLYDDLGNTWLYSEISPGNYEVEGVNAAVGRSYHIEIRIAGDGKVYRSDPQRMSGAGEISNLFSELKVHDGGWGVGKQYHFNVLLDAHTNPEDNYFLRWRTVGTFEVETHPELATKPDPNSPKGAEIPDPPLCSGWTYSEEEGLQLVGECTCCVCWFNDYSSSVTITPDSPIRGNELFGIHVAQIPVDKFRFFRKYHLEAQQMSVTEEVYRFWQRVKAQEESGNIFQGNISKVVGNIYNPADPSEDVFGIFAVSSVTTKSIVFQRSDAPELLPLPGTLIMPCTALMKGGKTVKPDFW